MMHKSEYKVIEKLYVFQNGINKSNSLTCKRFFIFVVLTHRIALTSFLQNSKRGKNES